MSALASPETPDARALELARHSRRYFLFVALGAWVLPLVFVLWVIWRSDRSDPDWVALPIVVALGWLLIFSILVLDARSRARKVRKTSEALPCAHLVCEATDPLVVPTGVRPLIIQLSGVSLCNGRGDKLRPVWELAWADISAADVSEFKYRLNTRPVVRITCRDGRTKFLLLVDKKRLTDALMDFPRRVADLINQHVGR
jgi:hypothetical protein